MRNPLGWHGWALPRCRVGEVGSVRREDEGARHRHDVLKSEQDRDRASGDPTQRFQAAVQHDHVSGPQTDVSQVVSE